jgi:hypothetical protein
MLSVLDLGNRDAGYIPDFGKNEQKNLQGRLFDEFAVVKCAIQPLPGSNAIFLFS